MRFACLLIACPALAAGASAPVASPADPLTIELSRARAEQAAAEAEAARLERAAGNARDEAARLRAEQAAAAQQIAASEARITAADTRVRLIASYLEARRARLQTEQQPVAALLAGLAVMADRPPLLAVADQGGTDELVKVRVLLDSTLPVIRRRTAALSAQMRQGERLVKAAEQARAELDRSRQDLLTKRRSFAALEKRALEAAASAGSQALGVGDVALSAGEDVERAQAALASGRAAASLTAALANEPPAPARPTAAEFAALRPGLRYELPATATVIDGLGSVDENGIRSRGLTMATARGTAVTAPAAGVVRFAGPFRDYDGVMIIDHGGGWTSVLINVSSQLRPGTRLRLGQQIGRAIGPLFVELSKNGTHRSPALIAGSSPTLSKGSKGG
jgi:septal ring factor EnvC (AmiA/AmiB activator)